MSTYYVTPSLQSPGRYDLRQERYRAQLAAGVEHPHDLMAVAFEPQALREQIAKHFPDTDASALPTA